MTTAQDRQDAVPKPAKAGLVVGDPRQGWAHADGVMSLGLNQPVVPAQAIDRLMIHETFARWGIAWDEGCLDVIRSLFTDDGELVILEATSKPLQHLKGHDAILEHVRRTRAVQADQRRHAITNIVVEQLDAEHATALAYGVVTCVKGGQIFLGATVFYRGDLIKHPTSGWQFMNFIIGMDAYARAKN
ncbi:MAG: nuclear transport factor 2 family protein [Hyphomicrobiaceae bacterium]|nr:SnoaL-like domain-containing protein [Hyphomicrobiaceae bacterium]